MTDNANRAAVRSRTAALGAVLVLAPALMLAFTTFAIGQGSAPATAPTVTAEAGSMSPDRRKEIEGVIKEYLIANPELLMEMQNALEDKMADLQAKRTAELVKSNASEIFHPAFSGVVGNPKGDVPVVEFFDYNCGYCRRAFGDVSKVIDKEKKVRFILKEFPILAKGSVEASRVALAMKMQGKYWEFHRAMLTNPGQADEASALRVAEKVGGDMARLKKDMTSPEIQNEIDATKALAAKLGIQGTPHFMIGDRVIPGAPENLYERMTKLITEVREEGCKAC